jgi:hypothetical protein
MPGLAGAGLIFQWIGMVEYIPCCTAPAEPWGLQPASRPASSNILIEQNIKKRIGPAPCVLFGPGYVCTVPERSKED